MSLSRGQFLILLLVLSSPLIFLPKIFNPYEFPRFLVFIIGAEILAVLFAFEKIKNKKFEVKLGFPAFLILGFLLINLISDIFGLDPKISLLGSNIRHQGFLTLVAGAILFFTTRYYFNSKAILFFKKAVLIVAFLISAISVWQGIQFNIFHNFVPTYNDRIIGTFGNPNFLGGYLTMLLPFILFNFAKRGLKILLIFFILSAVFFTDSRSAILALAFLTFIYGARLLFRLNLSKIIIIPIIVLVIGGAIGFTYSFIHRSDNVLLKTAIKERGCPESWPQEYPGKIITDIYKKDVFGGREALCDNRLLMWAVTLEALGKKPLLGFGQENLELAIPAGKMHKIDNAHNIFLETAASSGIFGLLLYIAIITYFLKKASVDIKLAIIVFLITAQFNPLSIAQIVLFWFLLGISDKKMNKT